MRRSTLLVLLAPLTLSIGCGDDASAEGPPAPPSTGADPSSTGPASPTSAGTAADETGASSSGTAGSACSGQQPAIVTDIDETLTLSDAEFIMQIADGTYDPIEREGAAALIGAYSELGYHVLYLTARSEMITVSGTDETAREATARWLQEHDFPVDPTRTSLVLAPMLMLGDDIQAYKAQALMDGQATGLRFDYAYGNATTDIGAYAEAGIPLAATFIIGEHAGEEGTVAIEGEGWVEHAQAHLPSVPAVCDDMS
ncbi:MAG: hypothetical protein AAGF11_39210 [Myxococcota bacterium]